MESLKEKTIPSFSPEQLRKYKIISFAIIGVFVALFLLDSIYLKGTVIFKEYSVALNKKEDQEFKFTVKRPQEKHTIKMSTRKREIALIWKVSDPEGNEIISESEMVRHDGERFDSFVPEIEGEYKITVGGQPGLIKGLNSKDRASVEIQVGNKQILHPLFNFFKF